MTLVHLALPLARLGYLDQARARREAAIVEARQLAHAFTLAFALGFGLLSEDVASQAVMLQAEELLALSMEHGFAFWEAVGALHRGRCLIMVGDEAEGIAQMTEALAAYRGTGTGLSLTHFLTLLADAHGRARQPLEGLEHLTDAIRTIERTEDREFEAELHRVRGELLLQVGDRSAAEESYCTALAVARRQSAKLWELRAAMSMARLWRDQGKRGQALEPPIYGWFTEGFDTLDLKQAKTLLDELA